MEGTVAARTMASPGAPQRLIHRRPWMVGIERFEKHLNSLKGKAGTPPLRFIAEIRNMGRSAFTPDQSIAVTTEDQSVEYPAWAIAFEYLSGQYHERRVSKPDAIAMRHHGGIVASTIANRRSAVSVHPKTVPSADLQSQPHKTARPAPAPARWPTTIALHRLVKPRCTI